MLLRTILSIFLILSYSVAQTFLSNDLASTSIVLPEAQLPIDTNIVDPIVISQDLALDTLKNAKEETIIFAQ
jgi:hypothetical protein